MRIAILAADQEGVVSARQLLAAGLNKAAIQLRVRAGRLHRVHVGVYAVGHSAITLRGSFKAATLAAGDASALSHYAAGTLDGYLSWDRRRIDVTVVGQGGRSRPGIRFHRVRVLDERDVFANRVIPVTTPARTLLDLADDLPDWQLRRATREAQARNLVNLRGIADVLTRANGRRGAPRLAKLFAEGPTPTRSDLEDLVLDVIDRAGIQRPQINRRLGRVYPDFRWPEQRLTVEADSATWHSGKLATEDDATRQARLEANGERVLRVTWQRALKEPKQTAARITAAGAPYTDRRS